MVLTPLSGDADLYLSTRHVRPNASLPYYEWHSNHYGADYVSIQTDADPLACDQCVYYIAGTVLAARVFIHCATYTTHACI